MTAYTLGRLLRAGTTGFIAGCSVSQLKAPAIGALVCAPLDESYKIYGIIHDIHIDDDGFVRQLVTAGSMDETTIADSRVNRIVPVEMSVLSVGFEQRGSIFHLLPPRPPLSLDVIYACPEADVVRFTTTGRFGYFRHILRAQDIPVGEILAAHLSQARQANQAAGNDGWFDAAARELITLLRDDYPTLMSVLGALGDSLPTV